MKKSIIICCIIFFSFFSRVSSEYSSRYEYKSLEDGTIEITKYVGDEQNLVIPSSIDGLRVTSIGSAFYFNNDMISVTIPDSVSSIGDYAFQFCDNLISVTIPDSVTNIGKMAFFSCRNLTSLTIPDSVTSIGESAFWGSDKLKLKIGSDNPVYVIIDDVLYNKEEKKLVSYLNNDTNDLYEIPKGIISIGDHAFDGCITLTSILIPDTVTNIGECAFCGSDLISITIPNSITKIEDYAFDGCIYLSSVTIPDSISAIGENAFRDCENLTSIIIPDSVVSIEDNAFDYCNNLVMVVERDSFARDYAIQHGIEYKYPDSYD